MKVVLLHGADAIEEPEDPVLKQAEDALKRLGHETSRVCAGGEIHRVTRDLLDAAPDLVLNLAESFNGKSALESNIAALLNLMNLRYTGSSPAGLMLAGDKVLTKKILKFHGIKSAEFATMYRGALEAVGDLQFPLIVKPPQEDASLGISGKSVVNDIRELLEQLGELHSEYQTPVLVEQYIEGREFYVGVIGNQTAEALPPMELDFSKMPADKPRIASWEAKWGDDGEGTGAEFEGTSSVFPEDLDEELLEELKRVAVESFQALRLRDYARIDLRVSKGGEVFVIEVNPNCYLEKSGEFARAAEKGGLEYDALIGRIVELAAARYAR
jgi:D-alanine-D-alanine ligase